MVVDSGVKNNIVAKILTDKVFIASVVVIAPKQYPMTIFSGDIRQCGNLLVRLLLRLCLLY